MADNAKSSRKPVDWEAIEREFRAGQLSVVEIGRQHSLSHTAINKRAKKHGWKRDLADRVRKEISARLVSDEVSEEVSAANARAAIETAASRGVEVVRQHRGDIKGQRDLVRMLVGELQEQSNPETNAALSETIDTETDSKRRASMQRAISLSARAGVMRDLAQAGKVLIDLERQAFSLDAGNNDTVQPKVSAEPLTDEEWEHRHSANERGMAPAGGASEGSR